MQRNLNRKQAYQITFWLKQALHTLYLGQSQYGEMADNLKTPYSWLTMGLHFQVLMQLQWLSEKHFV